MTVLGEAGTHLYARIFVSIAEEDGFFQQGFPGAVVKFLDNATGNEFWTGFTDEGGYSPWVDMTVQGYVAGDVVRTYAWANFEGQDYVEVKVVTLYPDAIYRFKWQRQTAPPPLPTAVTITVEASLPDPNYTGDYWIAHPEEVPVIQTPLAGVKVIVKKGYNVIWTGITGVSGEARTSLQEDTYTLTLSKEGYNTLTTTFTPSGSWWGETYIMEPGEDKPAFDLEWEKYLTWSNIAKAGAVVILVGFGSEAFMKFKEAFKK